MDLREEQVTGAVRHPWEVARFRFFSEVLRRHHLSDRAARVIDVGAGDAWFARQLLGQMPPGADMVCWDVGYDDASTQKRDNGIVRTAKKPTERADILLLLDVLEHVDDDVDFLTTLVRENTRPGSRVL